jgi:hypothetical protein
MINKITIVPEKAVQMAKRAFNRVVKDGFQRMGEEWHRFYEHKHFEEEAVRRYGYAPRSEKYERRKLRIKGHNDPLVWSGVSRRLASIVKVRATTAGASVVMNAPRLNMQRRASELTRVIPVELTVVDRRLARFIERKTPAV